MSPSAPLPRWISLGAGGHAASVVHALEGVAHLVAVVGPSARAWQVPVLGSDPEAIAQAKAEAQGIIVAIGDNVRRLSVLDQVPAELLLSAAATTASVASDVELGGSTVVLHQAHVGPGARLGRGTIVNTGAVVEHDALLGEGVHVAPGAAVLGAAQVGPGVLVGSGARVLPGIRVGAGATIGAGAVVIRDIAPGSVVTGVPGIERSRR